MGDQDELSDPLNVAEGSVRQVSRVTCQSEECREQPPSRILLMPKQPMTELIAATRTPTAAPQRAPRIPKALSEKLQRVSSPRRDGHRDALAP